VSGALRKTMIYLGLAEDDDRYAAYDDFEEDEYVPAVEEDREEERRAPVTPIQAQFSLASHLARLEDLYRVVATGAEAR